MRYAFRAIGQCGDRLRAADFIDFVDAANIGGNQRGRIDAAFASINAYDWDLAAADLLVHEAGGVMTNLAGELLVYNLHDPVHGAVLAAGRARHAAMLGLVRNRRKEFA